MNREILPKLKQLISDSKKNAKEEGFSSLQIGHLLISILNDDKNDSRRILNNLQISHLVLIDEIGEYVKNSEINVNFNSKKSFTLPNSKEIQKLFMSLDGISEQNGDSYIDTTHVFLYVLKTNSELKKMLVTHGLTYELFISEKNKLGNSDKNIKNLMDMNSGDFGGDDFGADKKIKKSSPTKTPVLDNFCVDINKMVEEGKIDSIIGRDDEIKRTTQILARRKKCNPILIGDGGVGKSAIIEGIAKMIVEGNAPSILSDKKIYSLDLSSLVAGTKYRGQFEERIKALLDELKLNTNVILFIDEMHTFVGAGNASGSLDAANIFKPALARGEIQVIGATTIKEFREHIEKDGALTRRFQQVLVNPTNLEQTKTILYNLKERYENFHRVQYTDEAIEECVKMADRYINDRAMPDKAIDILDEAGAATNVSHELPEHIKLLEEKRNNLQLMKNEVVKKQKYEEAAKLRDDESKVKVELEDAKAKWLDSLNKKRTVIGPELIAEVISMMTGIPVTKLSKQENKRLANLDVELKKKVIGQDNAVMKTANAIKRSRLGIKDNTKPITMFYLGATGTGKTLLTKALAETVYGDSDALIRVDMSEYMEKHSVAKLIGSPPGYVGHEEGGQLTEKIRKKPYSVVLFDEIEKGHESIFDILLQVMDEGHLTDSLGRKVNFKNCLIVLTSNVGAKDVVNFGKNMGFKTSNSDNLEEERVKSIIDKALKNKFKPEFLNRIDETIIFNSLTKDDINKIVYNEFDKLKKRLLEIGYEVNINKQAIEFLGKNGYDELYGARPLKRAIQKYVEDPIADEILKGNIIDNSTINITLDKAGDKLVIKN